MMIVIVALTCAGTAWAAWPHDPATNLLLSANVNGTDLLPELVPDGIGGTIVTWFDSRSGNQDVYAQHLSNKGVPLWPAGGVLVCSNPSNQSYPSAVTDGAGGAIITWHDLRAGTFDLYAQRIDGAGALQWAADGVPVCTAASNQYHLTTVSDGVGGMIAAWRDERSDGGNIYAQRLNGAGTALWAADGLVICAAAGIQQSPLLVSEDPGGAVVVWSDARGGSSVYAQRIYPEGSVAWPANGLSIATGAIEPTACGDGNGGAIIAWRDIQAGLATSNILIQRVTRGGISMWGAGGVDVSSELFVQENPRIVSDGAGGAIVTWMDWRGQNIDNAPDIFVQRMSYAGVALWAVDGQALVNMNGYQKFPEIASDGAGGAVVVWQDERDGTLYRNIYAGRVAATGVPQWTAQGVLVCAAASNQFLPAVIPDGRQGVIAAWYDPRGGLTYDLYAQRIDNAGLLGNPEPEIVAAKDLVNDQGGHVRIKWNASYRDALSSLNIGAYGVWRQVTASAAANILAQGGRAAETGAEPSASRGVIRTVAGATSVTYWEGVGSVLARGEPWYTFVAETFEDSTAAANPLTVYMVDAHDAHLPLFWSSVPDSGYSVDNLPPAAPAPFTGNYAGGAAHLDWGQNAENDLSGYRLYRGSTSGFAPGPGNLVAAPTGLHFDDPAPSGSFYKLSAIDIHGNESGFAALAFGTTDVSGAQWPAEFALAMPAPNPARTATALRFALPRASQVSLAVYDAGGREVRRLADGMCAAGEHAIGWDLRDSEGIAVASGVYWIRLRADGRELSRTVTHIR